MRVYILGVGYAYGRCYATMPHARQMADCLKLRGAWRLSVCACVCVFLWYKEEFYLYHGTGVGRGAHVVT